MLASRWGQSGGHWSWLSSVGVHAVSDNVLGPYIDKGMTWPSNQGGKGHNLTIVQLKNGTYASVVSDTRPGDFFTAPSLDGPWTFAGSITIDANGYSKPGEIANLSIIIRPDDGNYMIIERHGQIMISDNALTGPYKVQGASIYSGLAPNLEDPVLWYSGGYYHVVVNSWSDKKAYHLRSKDGKKNWTNEGIAFDPRSNFLRYTDGTVNRWTKIERPGVCIENGHVTHWTFSVISAEKENDKGNDDHNSKVIVVPFDGMAFDGVSTSVMPSEMHRIPAAPAIRYDAASLHLNIETDTDARISFNIFDLKGAMVKSVNIDPTFSERCGVACDLSGLHGGVYVTGLMRNGTTIHQTKFMHRKR
jgi:hypothetical protein